jgi:hypothetical protein
MGTMHTYVAEIGGVPIVVFQAEDDEYARELANTHADGLRVWLFDYNKPDGQPVWDGVSEIIVRRATEGEDARWLKARDASIGNSSGGAIIDPAPGDKLDDFKCYLIEVIAIGDSDFDEIG